MIVMARESTQCTRDVRGDGRLLGDDEAFHDGGAWDSKRDADTTEGAVTGARLLLAELLPTCALAQARAASACMHVCARAYARVREESRPPERCQRPPGRTAMRPSSSSVVNAAARFCAVIDVRAIN